MESFPSVSQVLEQWLKAHALGRRAATIRFHQEIARVILEGWPDPAMPAAAVTVDQVLELSARVSHYCPSRWNAIVTMLQAVTSAARALRRRRLRFREFSPPSQSQFSAFLQECDRLKRSQAGSVVRFLAFTGLRISEAMALTWSSVLADRIEVPAALAKSGHARSIPLLPGVDQVLERLRSVSDGEHVLPRGTIRKGLAIACRRAGLSRLSPHCFRHLFATRCIESGVDVPTVARWLGHQDGGALLSRMYFHLLDDHSRQMALKVRIAA
jgi:integrase